MAEVAIGDSKEAVEIGINTYEIPWVLITDEDIDGSLGCNEFFGPGDDYALSWDRLVPGLVGFTDRLCGDDALMEVEEILRNVLWSEEIRVDVDENTMTWTVGDTQLVFSR